MISQYTVIYWLTYFKIDRDLCLIPNGPYRGVLKWRHRLACWIWASSAKTPVFYDPLQSQLYLVENRLQLIAERTRKFNDPSRAKMIELWADQTKSIADHSIYRLMRMIDLWCGILIGAVLCLVVHLL